MNDLLAGAEPVTDKGYKIISLVAENVKRLTAVDIKPDGNLVEISGRNGAGKTSVLDAIWWAMKGRGVVQATPIRRGCDEARIELNLGPIIVQRKFRAGKDGEGWTTSITVEGVDGFRASSPQKLLDSLMGELSVDPLAFMRMEGKQQLDMLRGFVRGFDFDAHDRQRGSLFAKRTEVNRDAKQARAAAQQVSVPSDLPTEMVDEAALIASLEVAGTHNAELESRRERRQRAADLIDALNGRAVAVMEALPGRIAAVNRAASEMVAELERQIKELHRRIATVNAEVETDVTNANDLAVAERDAALNEAKELQAKLDAAGPLPEQIDSTAITARITEARNTNAGIRLRTQRDRSIDNAIALEAQAQELTDAIAAADKAKADAIASVKLPVAGIEFGDGALMLDGLPLDQASDAEQLRVSVAIAMAMHPKLRVIRVRDGNVLDADGMKLLAELAQQHDCQVWVETVRADDRVAFVIEDGRVKKPATETEE